MNNPFAFPKKQSLGAQISKKMLFIFGKNGKPHDSVAATLKTSPQTAWMDWFGIEAYFKKSER